MLLTTFVLVQVSYPGSVPRRSYNRGSSHEPIIDDLRYTSDFSTGEVNKHSSDCQDKNSLQQFVSVCHSFEQKVHCLDLIVKTNLKVEKLTILEIIISITLVQYLVL